MLNAIPMVISKESFEQIFISPNREINSCLRLSGKLQKQNAPLPMLVTLEGMTISDRERVVIRTPIIPFLWLVFLIIQLKPILMSWLRWVTR